MATTAEITKWLQEMKSGKFTSYEPLRWMSESIDSHDLAKKFCAERGIEWHPVKYTKSYDPYNAPYYYEMSLGFFIARFTSYLSPHNRCVTKNGVLTKGRKFSECGCEKIHIYLGDPELEIFSWEKAVHLEVLSGNIDRDEKTTMDPYWYNIFLEMAEYIAKNVPHDPEEEPDNSVPVNPACVWAQRVHVL